MKELAFKLKSDFLKLLAHPVRLQIIEILKSGERRVGDIVKKLDLPQSSLSRHLLVLREGGVLKSRQHGTVVYYNIEDQAIFDILRQIAAMLRRKLKKTSVVLNSLGR